MTNEEVEKIIGKQSFLGKNYKGDSEIVIQYLRGITGFDNLIAKKGESVDRFLVRITAYPHGLRMDLEPVDQAEVRLISYAVRFEEIKQIHILQEAFSSRMYILGKSKYYFGIPRKDEDNVKIFLSILTLEYELLNEDPGFEMDGSIENTTGQKNKAAQLEAKGLKQPASGSNIHLILFILLLCGYGIFYLVIKVKMNNLSTVVTQQNTIPLVAPAPDFDSISPTSFGSSFGTATKQGPGEIAVVFDYKISDEMRDQVLKKFHFLMKDGSSSLLYRTSIDTVILSHRPTAEINRLKLNINTTNSDTTIRNFLQNYSNRIDTLQHLTLTVASKLKPGVFATGRSLKVNIDQYETGLHHLTEALVQLSRDSIVVKSFCIVGVDDDFRYEEDNGSGSALLASPTLYIAYNENAAGIRNKITKLYK